MKKEEQAFKELERTFQKANQRMEKKFWSRIPIRFSLKESLEHLSKEDLHTIRKRYDIKNASSLNKTDLVARFIDEIPPSIEHILLTWDIDRYNLIKQIVQQGGQMKAPQLEFMQLNYFRTTGFLLTGTQDGEKVLALPSDILEPLSTLFLKKDLKAIMKRNTTWIRLTQGLLFYYGILPLETLIKMIESYTKEDLNLIEYLQVIHDSLLYYEEIEYDQFGFSHVEVYDPEEVIREQQMRVGLDYYPFSKEALIKAGEPFYSDENESTRKLVHFLVQQHHLSQMDADRIVEECQFAIQTGQHPTTLLEIVQDYIEFDHIESVQAVMDKLMDLMNHTRQWVLKGHTPRELSKREKKSLRPLPASADNVFDLKTKQKIGRNDPCPCGSEKKYKKCCGKA